MGESVEVDFKGNVPSVDIHEIQSTFRMSETDKMRLVGMKRVIDSLVKAQLVVKTAESVKKESLGGFSFHLKIVCYDCLWNSINDRLTKRKLLVYTWKT